MYTLTEGTARDTENRAGGGQSTTGPWKLAIELVQQTPAIRLTPGHPESTHCQESFRNPPALHAAAVQGLRQSPDQQF